MPGSDREPVIYLTFDDGPDPDCTSRILDILLSNAIKATFFVIVNNALRYPELVLRAQREGHAIGNHSLDHRYKRFFGTKKSVFKWVDESEQKLKGLLNSEPIAWRSPAGVRTPELRLALRKLKIAFVHWDIRFYDTTRKLTQKRINASFSKLRHGSIILLHDNHRGDWADNFLIILDAFIKEGKARGFQFAALPRLSCLGPVPK